MKKITKTGYQAEDGSEFDTEFECRIYEIVGDTSDIYDIIEILYENKKELLKILKEEQELETKLSDDQWDFLGVGEKIQEGDEYYMYGRWNKTNNPGYSITQNRKYRRKKPAYRYLEIGEEIKKEDEYYSESLERWINWGGIGYKVDNQNTYRRKL